MDFRMFYCEFPRLANHRPWFSYTGSINNVSFSDTEDMRNIRPSLVKTIIDDFAILIFDDGNLVTEDTVKCEGEDMTEAVFVLPGAIDCSHFFSHNPLILPVSGFTSDLLRIV